MQFFIIIVYITFICIVFIYYFVFYTLYCLSDLRQGQCFFDVTGEYNGRGICSTEIGERKSKTSCCCSVGKGWGPTCEVCPRINTSKLSQVIYMYIFFSILKTSANLNVISSKYYFM